MKLRQRLSPRDVRVHIEAHPRLADGIRRIARETGVPEEKISQHLGEAMLETLDRFGERYIAEMGATISRVERVRERVRGFYDRVLSGQDLNPSMSELEGHFAELHKELSALQDVQDWAAHQRHQPAEAAPAPPAPPPSIVLSSTPVARRARRRGALSSEQHAALRRAEVAHPELFRLALEGDLAATSALAERLTADGVKPPEVRQLLDGLGAVQNPDFTFALGGSSSKGASPQGQVAAAFEALPENLKSAVREAADADPELVRSIIMSDIGHGDARALSPWPEGAARAFAAKHGMSEARGAEIEGALLELHRARRREAGKSASQRDPTFGLKGDERRKVVDALAGSLGLPDTGMIKKALLVAPSMRDLAQRAPDHFAELASLWVERAAALAAEGKKPPTLRDYVRNIMRTQVRGMHGEFTAIFALGREFWVMKGPDHAVTLPGTDYVVVSKTSGEIWFCDNKALSDHHLGRVSSLVENFPRNLADDLTDFEGMRRAPTIELPPQVTSALANARLASTEITALTGNLSREAILGVDVQRRITEICDRHGVRRVVSNAGGELTALSAGLTQHGIDLANLEAATPVLPQRPLKPGGAQ